MTTIYRTRPTSGFTTILNDLLRRDDMSFGARGLLAMILSHKDDWVVSQTWLNSRSTDTAGKRRKYMRELEEKGYAVYSLERYSTGRFGGNIWTFYDTPVPPEKRSYRLARSRVVTEMQKTECR